MKQRFAGIILCCLAVAGLFGWLLSSMPVRGEKVAVEIEEYEAWSDKVVEAAKGVPVQEGGRVKPLMTVGRFHLMGLSGKGKAYYLGKDQRPVAIGPTEWILDCLFRPRFAVDMRVFLVEDSIVLDELGVPEEEQGKRRDLYSYRQLLPFKDKLLESTLLADRAEKEGMELTELQVKLRTLRDKFISFEEVTGTFAFSAQSVRFDGEMADDRDLPKQLGFMEFLKVSYAFVGAVEQMQASGKKPADGLLTKAQFARLMESSAKRGLKFLAPITKTDAEWATYGHLIQSLNEAEGRDKEGNFNSSGLKNYNEVIQVANLYILANQGREQFESDFLKWSNERKKEGEKIPSAERAEVSVTESAESEVSYYDRHYLHYGMGFFLLGFLAVSFGWLAPGGGFGKVCRWLALALVVLGTGYVTAAVIHRSIIMWRPPVGNLFDTIPFIVATGGLVVIVIELLTRRGLAVGIGAAFGIGGVFLALRYEAGTGQDTMTPLVAVLRSNYWLTTHVITVTLGYMGALLAAAISHVYLIGRVTGLDGGDKKIRRALTRMTYGVVGFALLFSLVGTILGGIWANDSWGRFWGWDPKENGALMIVLMNLIILHARIGGVVKEFGLHMLSVFGAIVVGFSWWGVNMLGVGLHSYGFTDGARTLNLFYAVEFSLLGLFIALEKFREGFNSSPRKNLSDEIKGKANA